jgi:hypothetical protein
MFEAMGLKVVALRSPALALPPYKISSKSINWFKSYCGDTHTHTHTHTHTYTYTYRPTGDLISLLSFLESRLTILKTQNSACYSKYMEKIQLVIRKNEWMNNNDMYKSL